MATQSYVSGFSLLELMVVVLLVAFLGVLALPSYQRHLLATHRKLATVSLLEVNARQAQFLAAYRRYADDLQELGYEDSPTALCRNGRECSVHDPRRIYRIELATSEGRYHLLALPQLGQADDDCKILSLDNQGRKGSSGWLEVSDCW